MMAFLSLFLRRQLPPAASHFARIVKPARPRCAGAPLKRLHGSSRLRVVEKGPWGKSRGPEQQYQLSDLDKADALVGSARQGYIKIWRLLKTKNVSPFETTYTRF